jgi:hypothetical protein
MYIGLHVKYPLFLSDINENLIFSTDFLKIHKYQISWKSVWWELSCSMRTEGRTDRTNLIVAFRNFAYAPKNAFDFAFVCTVRMTVWEQKGRLSILRDSLLSVVAAAFQTAVQDRLVFTSAERRYVSRYVFGLLSPSLNTFHRPPLTRLSINLCCLNQ